MKKITLLSIICVSNITLLFSQEKNAEFLNFPDGSVVCYSNINDKRSGYQLCDNTNAALVKGIYSKELDISGNTLSPGGRPFPVLLDQAIAASGIVSARYNLQNGIIRKGDLVSFSSEPGVIARAIESGMIIGVALENADADKKEGLIKIRVMIQYAKL